MHHNPGDQQGQRRRLHGQRRGSLWKVSPVLRNRTPKCTALRKKPARGKQWLVEISTRIGWKYWASNQIALKISVKFTLKIFIGSGPGLRPCTSLRPITKWLNVSICFSLVRWRRNASSEKFGFFYRTERTLGRGRRNRGCSGRPTPLRTFMPSQCRCRHRLILLKLDAQSRSHLVVEVCTQQDLCTALHLSKRYASFIARIAGRWFHRSVYLVLTIDVYVSGPGINDSWSCCCKTDFGRNLETAKVGHFKSNSERV